MPWEVTAQPTTRKVGRGTPCAAFVRLITYQHPPRSAAGQRTPALPGLRWSRVWAQTAEVANLGGHFLWSLAAVDEEQHSHPDSQAVGDLLQDE